MAPLTVTNARRHTSNCKAKKYILDQLVAECSEVALVGNQLLYGAHTGLEGTMDGRNILGLIANILDGRPRKFGHAHHRRLVVVLDCPNQCSGTR